VLLSAGAVSAATITDYLNLRTGPGTSYSVIDVMPAGSEIVVSRCRTSWCRVVWNGAEGYAFRDYISSGEPVYQGPPAGAVASPPYYGASPYSSYYGNVYNRNIYGYGRY
jgi:hypothetical protein